MNTPALTPFAAQVYAFFGGRSGLFGLGLLLAGLYVGSVITWCALTLRDRKSQAALSEEPLLQDAPTPDEISVDHLRAELRLGQKVMFPSGPLSRRIWEVVCEDDHWRLRPASVAPSSAAPALSAA